MLLSIEERTKQLWEMHEHIIGLKKRIVPGSMDDIRFLSLAMAGEAGEVANCVKKEWRGDDFGQKEMDELVEEVADTFHYLLILAKALNIDIEVVSAAKIGKVYDKWYPDLSRNKLLSNH